MPRVRGNAHIGHFEERLLCYLRNLDAVAVLRFRVRDEPLQGCAQRLVFVESEDGGLDFVLAMKKKVQPASRISVSNAERACR
jgi:hypothetical protein